MTDAPEVKRGTVYHDHIGPIRVMVVHDGYAMVRRPGCMPWVEPVKAVCAKLDGHVSETADH